MDKFLKKLQGLIKESKDKGHIIIRIEDLEKEFPELVENNEDEIKKEIIGFLKAIKRNK